MWFLDRIIFVFSLGDAWNVITPSNLYNQGFIFCLEKLFLHYI